MRLQTSRGRIGENLGKRIGRFFARIDDSYESALIVKNSDDFIKNPMRTETTNGPNERMCRLWRRLQIHHGAPECTPVACV
jgi:hypothetical protein